MSSEDSDSVAIRRFPTSMRITSTFKFLAVFSPTIFASVKNEDDHKPSADADVVADYPDSESLEALSYSIISILEREEAFAGMLKDLISKLMPVGYNALSASTEILTLAALVDVAERVMTHQQTLDSYEKAVDGMIQTNLKMLQDAVGVSDNSVTGSGNR